MKTESLWELRRRIECRATESGQYRVACAQTGENPIPVRELRFPSRSVARAAAWETTLYRNRLRELDPQTAIHELVVHEEPQLSDMEGAELVSEAFWALVG